MDDDDKNAMATFFSLAIQCANEDLVAIGNKDVMSDDYVKRWGFALLH